MLNQTVAIQRKTEGKNALGGLSTTWATVATVKGSVQAAGSSERYFLDRETGEARYSVYLPPRTDVRTGDRLIVDGDATRPIYVEGQPTTAAGRGVYTFVNGTERKGGGIK